MKENEAIERIRSGICNEIGTQRFCKDSCMYGIDKCAYSMAIQALEEIQQYRAIGTVDELKSMKENGAFSGVELAQLAIMQMRLRDYEAIGTIEELQALKEKSVAKKPNQVSRAMDKDEFAGLIGRCPNCGSIVAEDNFVCEDCFQVLDWQ